MAVPVSLKNAVVTLYDADGGESVVLTAEDGDLTLDGLLRPGQHILDRGAPGNIIEGAHVDLSGSMTLQLQAMSASSEHILHVMSGDANGTGTWNEGVVDTSSGRFATGATTPIADLTTFTNVSASTNVPLFNIEIVLTNPSTGSTEKWPLINCHASANFTEGFPTKLNVNFTCYGWSFENLMEYIEDN